MSFSAARGASVTFSRNIRRLVQSKKAEIEQVKREVLGHAPQLNIRTGYQMNKKQLTGVYLNQAYPDFIEKSARKVIPGFKSELEERKAQKLAEMKRLGKGPPKKGSSRASRKRK